MARSTSERYFAKVKRFGFYAGFAGANISRCDYKINLATYNAIAAIVAYFVFTFYTIYLRAANDWMIILECLVFAGGVCQGISKLATVYHASSIYKTFTSIRQVYITYEKRGAEFKECLEKSVVRLERLWRLGSVIYLVAASTITFLPLIILLVFGEKILVVKYELPLLPPDTEIGYWITYFVHGAQVLLGGVGTFSGDMLFIIIIIQATVLADILKVKWKNLDKLLTQCDQETIDSEEIKKLVKDIIVTHQDYCSYCKTMNEHLFWVISTLIITSAFSMSITLFTIFAGTWPGAYAYLVLSFSLIFSYCGLGSVYEATNDSIVEAIYSSYWYKLPVKEQKTILVMLAQSQHPVEITVGGIVPLNVNTGVKVMKSIYSYMMMLVNFLEE